MSWGSWNIALPSGRCLGYVWLRNWLSVQWISMLWPEMIETIFVLIFTGHYWGWRGWSENCFLLGLPLGSGCWCRSHRYQPISSQPFLKQECLYIFKVAPPWNKRLELLIAKCRAHPRKCSKWGCAACLSTQKSLSFAENFQIASRTGFIDGPLFQFTQFTSSFNEDMMIRILILDAWMVGLKSCHFWFPFVGADSKLDRWIRFSPEALEGLHP